MNRKLLLLPNDIKSSIINSTSEYFSTPTDELIRKFTSRNRLFCLIDGKIEAKKCKEPIKALTKLK